jgi:energy-coupling factor transporter ATP-binding protein EcfA2
VVILHDLNLATLFAERVVVLDRGGVARDGPAGETITDDMLAQVFGIAAGVGRLPAPGVPFVLPQTMQIGAARIIARRRRATWVIPRASALVIRRSSLTR